ncbi:MAG TPA: hypothetical protein ENH19_00740, partial [Actinobacteria bacterium]|nr:hypothetical protein [Actinomycetes bacterium]HEX21163.1 hypothetical protein [Actinomycetota bacterium]
NLQIEPLKKQARTAAVYNEITEELAEEEVNYYVSKLRSYQTDWDKLKAKIIEVDCKIEEMKDRLDLQKKNIADCEAELESRLKIDSNAGNNLRKFAGIKEQIKSGLLLLQEKKRNLEERLSDLRDIFNEINADERIKSTELARSHEAISASDSRLNALHEKLVQAEITAERLKENGSLLAEKYDEVYKRLNSHLSTIKKEREILNKDESVISAGGEQVKFLAAQLEKISSRLESMAAARDSVDAEILSLKDEWMPLTKEIADRQIKIDNLGDIVEAKQKELDALTVKKDGLSARITVLKGMSNDLRDSVGIGNGLLKDKNNFPALLGPLFELIKVKPKYETAIESALSYDLYSLVADDMAAAKRIFASIHEHEDGFISLVLTDYQNDEVRSEPNISWAIPAMEVVGCPQKINPALTALLGRVYIVNSLDILFNNINESAAEYDFVTLNGDLLTAHGSLRHGVFTQNKSGAISCLRETAELEAEEIRIERKSIKISRILEDDRFNLKKEQNYVLKLSTRAQAIERELAEMEIGRRHLADDEDTLRLQKQELAAQISGREVDIEKQNTNKKAKSLTIDKDEDT